MREGYISPRCWQLFQNLGTSRLFSYFHSQTKELQVTLSSWEQPGNVCAQCSVVPLGFLRANRSCASSLDFQGQSQRNLPGKVWDQEEMLPAAHPCAGGFTLRTRPGARRAVTMTLAGAAGLPQGSALLHTGSTSPSLFCLLWIQGHSPLP